MNPVLANLPASERPEAACTGCKHSIWHVGTHLTEKIALAAFCGVLGQQVYSSLGDGQTVQVCAAYEPPSA